MTLTYEMCCACDSPTGRAGRDDDSLYCPVCDAGPFCEECFEKHDCEIGDKVAE